MEHPEAALLPIQSNQAQVPVSRRARSQIKSSIAARYDAGKDPASTITPRRISNRTGAPLPPDRGRCCRCRHGGGGGDAHVWRGQRIAALMAENEIGLSFRRGQNPCGDVGRYQALSPQSDSSCSAREEGAPRAPRGPRSGASAKPAVSSSDSGPWRGEAYDRPRTAFRGAVHGLSAKTNRCHARGLAEQRYSSHLNGVDAARSKRIVGGGDTRHRL